ncbi:GFA family protein [Roseivivax lentus]|uniref:GFA family protein n=1 Tax=Roseivivax lentus TaxID=633194 RepID=UPI0009710A1E|nr:GFA family protein [Roseivivax lentus]
MEDPVWAHGLDGACLCGAVRIRVERHRAEVGACHCSRCRIWSGALFAVFSAPPASVTVEGPVSVYPGEIAERAFCGTCGSNLWLRDNDDGAYEFMIGAFPGAKDYPLISEIYHDKAFAAVTLAGDHRRTDAAPYEAENPHLMEG